MVAVWYLLMLAPLIAIAIFWWLYQRKQAQRERLANERWQQMVSKAVVPEKEAPVMAAMPPAMENPRSGAAPAVPGYRSRERLLDPAETLFYFLLRTGVPEFEVLCGVGLSRLLQVSAATEIERERLARNLTQQTVDFVLCDKTMQPRVAIDLLTAEAPAALTASPDSKTLCFAHTGIRYVRISRTALPKRQDVRAIVLGEGAAP